MKTNENKFQAQCTKCGYVGEREISEDDGSSTSSETADECPRCGYDRVLTGSIEVGA